ncbi:hypothetical protein [Levilactobacillus koreensis]|nr:hypothetical protein [Levilactobacillus koreensis]
MSTRFYSVPDVIGDEVLIVTRLLSIFISAIKQIPIATPFD